jgi:hypothetical protein
MAYQSLLREEQTVFQERSVAYNVVTICNMGGCTVLFCLTHYLVSFYIILNSLSSVDFFLI